MADRLQPFSGKWSEQNGNLTGNAQRWLNILFGMIGGKQLDTTTNIVEIVNNIDADLTEVEEDVANAQAAADEATLLARIAKRPSMTPPFDHAAAVLAHRMFG
jgi:hypothetical protein